MKARKIWVSCHHWGRIQSGSKHPAHKPGCGIESFRRPDTHHQATTESRECYQRCVTAPTLTSAFTGRLSLVLSAQGQPHRASVCPSLISLTVSMHVKHRVYLLSFCVCRTTSEDFKNQSNKPLFPSCRFLANTESEPVDSSARLERLRSRLVANAVLAYTTTNKSTHSQIALTALKVKQTALKVKQTTLKVKQREQITSGLAVWLELRHAQTFSFIFEVLQLAATAVAVSGVIVSVGTIRLF